MSRNQLIDKYFELFSSRNSPLTLCKEIFADDIELMSPIAEAKTLDEVRNAYWALARMTAKCNILEVMGTDGKFCIAYELVLKETNLKSLKVTDLLTIKDGKITKILQNFDTSVLRRMTAQI